MPVAKTVVREEEAVVASALAQQFRVKLTFHLGAALLVVNTQHYHFFLRLVEMERALERVLPV
jgi:hypothetical protein